MMIRGGVLVGRIQMLVLWKSMTMLPVFRASSVLVVVVGLIPQSVVFSQDFVAVERRLGTAVAEGEVTLAQAKAMMDALHATRKVGGHASLKMQLEERLKVYAETLRKQVLAGDISKEEAQEKYEVAGRKMESRYREVVTGEQSREGDEQMRSKLEVDEHSRSERRAREHHSDDDARDVDVNEQLRNAVEKRLRYHGENLRAKVAKGEISREEMETEYKAVQRRILGEARKAESHRKRDTKSPDAYSDRQNQELRELRRAVEARIRQNGERLRQQFAAGVISGEEMEEQYLAAEHKMWNHYRQAELKMQPEQEEAVLSNESDHEDNENDESGRGND